MLLREHAGHQSASQESRALRADPGRNRGNCQYAHTPLPNGRGSQSNNYPGRAARRQLQSRPWAYGSDGSPQNGPSFESGHWQESPTRHALLRTQQLTVHLWLQSSVVLSAGGQSVSRPLDCIPPRPRFVICANGVARRTNLMRRPARRYLLIQLGTGAQGLQIPSGT